MGNILSAIRDDIEDYERRCKKYGEKVQTVFSYGNSSPDCYGEHARQLEEREREEWEANSRRQEIADRTS